MVVAAMLASYYDVVGEKAMLAHGVCHGQKLAVVVLSLLTLLRLLGKRDFLRADPIVRPDMCCSRTVSLPEF